MRSWWMLTKIEKHQFFIIVIAMHFFINAFFQFQEVKHCILLKFVGF